MNTTKQTTGQEKIMLLVLGLFALYGLFIGVGILANRLACGAWASPQSPLAGLEFFATQDPAAFGTADGCSATPGWLAVVLLVTLVIVGIIVAASVAAYRRYKQSDKYFNKDVASREGIAQGAEVRRVLKNSKKTVKKVRPTQKRPRLADAALRLGQSVGTPIWVSLEESLLLIGPPRSGKGLHLLIQAILDAPGPVITTSSRSDNYAATAEMRAKKGPVALFDPQGLTGKPTTLKWSPITGCEKPVVANQRASSLIGASGLGSSGNNAEWKAPATTIMECLLHAAALGNRTVDDLMEWGTNQASARRAVAILKDHPQAASGWGAALEGIIDGDPKMLQNKWFGVEGCVKGLSVPEVREALKPTSVEETFDIDRFINESGTLYIVGTKTGGSSAGPFLIAMMDAITERAREIAAKRPGNRLDPPMSLVLDEIANISGSWPGLTQLMADGGGVGISPFAVFQSMAQARNEWGEQEASALFDAATVKVQLGGAANTDDLKVFNELGGHRQITRRSKSWQKDGASVSEQVHDVDVLPIADLRRIPFGRGLLLQRNGRPIYMSMVKWVDRKDSKEIKASLGRYNSSLLEALTNGDQQVSEEVLTTGAEQPAATAGQTTGPSATPEAAAGLDELIREQNEAVQSPADQPTPATAETTQTDAGRSTGASGGPEAVGEPTGSTDEGGEERQSGQAAHLPPVR